MPCRYINLPSSCHFSIKKKKKFLCPIPGWAIFVSLSKIFVCVNLFTVYHLQQEKCPEMIFSTFRMIRKLTGIVHKETSSINYVLHFFAKFIFDLLKYVFHVKEFVGQNFLAKREMKVCDVFIFFKRQQSTKYIDARNPSIIINQNDHLLPTPPYIYQYICAQHKIITSKHLSFTYVSH